MHIGLCTDGLYYVDFTDLSVDERYSITGMTIEQICKMINYDSYFTVSLDDGYRQVYVTSDCIMDNCSIKDKTTLSFLEQIGAILYKNANEYKKRLLGNRQFDCKIDFF
jgi:hypothetical protein